MKFRFRIPQIIALQCVVLSCSAEEEDAVYWDRRCEIIQISQKIELGRYRLSQLAPSIPDEPLADLPSLEARRNSLQLKKNQLRDAVGKLRECWDEFRRETLATTRAELIGKEYENFRTEGGRDYKNAVITEICDLGVTLRHAHGSARVLLHDLSAEEQAFFGLDPDFATAAQSQERQKLTSYERWFDEEMMVIQEKQKNKEEARKANEERVARNLARARSNAMRASAAVTPQTPSGRGEAARGSTHYYRYSRPTRHYQNVSYYGNFGNTAASWNQQCNTPLRAAQSIASPVCPPAYRPVVLNNLNLTPYPAPEP